MTPKQKDGLFFICEYISNNIASPSYEEIKEGLGLSSKSNVGGRVDLLIAEGYLRKTGNGARALEPTEKGWDAYRGSHGFKCPNCGFAGDL